jgi:hypothetical protein
MATRDATPTGQDAEAGKAEELVTLNPTFETRPPHYAEIERSAFLA